MSGNSKKNRSERRQAERMQAAVLEKPTMVSSIEAAPTIKVTAEKQPLTIKLLQTLRKTETTMMNKAKNNPKDPAWVWFKSKMALLAAYAMKFSAWVLEKIISFLEWIQKKWDQNKERLQKAWKSLTEEAEEVKNVEIKAA